MPRLNRFKKISRKREEATAREIGGRVTPGSGSIDNPYMKEDVHNEHFVLQHKTCTTKGYRLTRKDLTTCEDHALMNCKMPLWRIEFPDHDVAIIRWQDLIPILLKAGML